jgi:MoaA/NifB/PqqE/SkfB family radical SAM enzyme
MTRYSTAPIDVVSETGVWLMSYRYEPFLDRWFVLRAKATAKDILLTETENVPRAILSRASQEVDEWDQRSYRAPVKMQIQLNTNCNYYCEMCYANAIRGGVQRGELQKQELAALFYQLKRWGVFRVNFVGGEVFMRPDLEEIIEAAGDARLLVSLITNARIPGANIARYEKLLADLFNVQVSCNGTRTAYEKEYGESSWSDAARCIERVIGVARTSILSYVVTEHNYTCIADFLDFAAGITPSSVKFAAVCWRGRSRQVKAAEYYRKVIPEAQKAIVEGRKRYPQLDIASQFDQGLQTPLLQEFDRDYRPFEFYFSPEGRDGLYVNAIGTVFPYPLLSDVAELRLGNIRTGSIREMWERHEVLQAIRRITFAGSECGAMKCPSPCGLWSRAHAIAWSDKLDGKVPCALDQFQIA